MDDPTEVTENESLDMSPSGDDVPGPADFASAFEAPKEATPNIDLADFAHFESPRPSRKKGALGPDDKEELADFFTQDGIGAIVARGMDAFFTACDAEKMSQSEFNNMAKVVAYYCRARLPKEAGNYQPELLLFATIGMATLPRMGPIAEKTAPFWRRMIDRARGAFRKRES